jgi:hypothetical protein
MSKGRPKRRRRPRGMLNPEEKLNSGDLTKLGLTLTDLNEANKPCDYRNCEDDPCPTWTCVCGCPNEDTATICMCCKSARVEPVVG